MKLKEVCERTGITKRNIHYYVKEGLLVPRKELGNGYYEFSEEDCDRLLMIRSLRNAGFSILQIRSRMQPSQLCLIFRNAFPFTFGTRNWKSWSERPEFRLIISKKRSHRILNHMTMTSSIDSCGKASFPMRL